MGYGTVDEQQFVDVPVLEGLNALLAWLPLVIVVQIGGMRMSEHLVTALR